jgi:hypothetical protein
VAGKRQEDLAADFWERAGGGDGRPRPIEAALVRAAPVWVVRGEGLTPAAVARWLRRRGLKLPLPADGRALGGCLVAFRGCGAVFVEAGLTPDEARVVIAHEGAHFLTDYEAPRERALRRLGPSVLPVLDGDRPATAAEGWAAALAGVRLGAHTHYMDRTYDPARTAATDAVERAADELALELLAPRQLVTATLGARGPLPGRAEPWERLLVERFALPRRWAAFYARRLAAAARRRKPFTEHLGF